MRRTVGSNIFRCNTRSSTNCPGRVYTDDDLNVIYTVEHINHPQEYDYVQRHTFRQEICRLCETTFASFADIFNETCLRYH